MTMPVAKRRYTIEEYLELELAALDKHEFHDGEILGMSGGSLEQSLIAANTVGELRAALKGKPCRVTESNLRVRIPRNGRYLYPDALAYCGPPEFDPKDNKRHTILNPRVVIEVLSPSTEADDRGEKFKHYRDIESLEEYILIFQDRANLESWLRQPDGARSIVNYTELNSSATIRCLGVTIPLTEIYAGVEFPPPAPPPGADGIRSAAEA